MKIFSYSRRSFAYQSAHTLRSSAIHRRCIGTVVVDEKYTPNKFGDASTIDYRIYCEYQRTYAVIILQSRYTPNVKPISGRAMSTDASAIMRRLKGEAEIYFSIAKNFNANIEISRDVFRHSRWVAMQRKYTRSSVNIAEHSHDV